MHIRLAFRFSTLKITTAPSSEISCRILPQCSSVFVGEDGNAISDTALCRYMYAFFASFTLGSSITAWKTETVWMLVMELLIVKLILFIFIPDIALFPPRIEPVGF